MSASSRRSRPVFTPAQMDALCNALPGEEIHAHPATIKVLVRRGLVEWRDRLGDGVRSSRYVVLTQMGETLRLTFLDSERAAAEGHAEDVAETKITAYGATSDTAAAAVIAAREAAEHTNKEISAGRLAAPWADSRTVWRTLGEALDADDADAAGEEMRAAYGAIDREETAEVWYRHDGADVGAREGETWRVTYRVPAPLAALPELEEHTAVEMVVEARIERDPQTVNDWLWWFEAWATETRTPYGTDAEWRDAMQQWGATLTEEQRETLATVTAGVLPLPLPEAEAIARGEQPPALTTPTAPAVPEAQFLTLDTSQLRRGDIVHEHGMRVRLHRETSQRPGVWHWEGTVINLPEVRKGGHVPPSFLRTYRWNGGGWVTDREDHWAVQGNTLATWYVERRELPGPDDPGMEWVRLNVLPPLWREETEDLRTCACQTTPTLFPNVPAGPEGRLWNRDGRTVAQDGRLVVFHLADRTCRWGAALAATT